MLSSLLLLVFLNPACNKEKTILSPEIGQFITDQYSNMLDVAEDLSKIPRRIDEEGVYGTSMRYPVMRSGKKRP